ncbi:hypothetical protein M3Y97_00241500 [Aphelenchoides bicaudatus]|nr:hypothetical protein M3Y97_00241500 [Aphelenchoides bicaudatus]
MLNIFVRKLGGGAGLDMYSQYKIDSDKILPVGFTPDEMVERFQTIRDIHKKQPARTYFDEHRRVPSRKQVLEPVLLETDDRDDRVSIWMALNSEKEHFLYQSPVDSKKKRRMRTVIRNFEYAGAYDGSTFESLSAPDYIVPNWRMSEDDSKPVRRRSTRLKVSQPAEPLKLNSARKRELEEFTDESSGESSFDEKPKPKKTRKQPKNDNKENTANKRQPKASEEHMELDETELDEIDQLDLPELNAPKEWMDLLEARPSTSKQLTNSTHNKTIEHDSSDEEEWHEVEDAKPSQTTSKKATIEVQIEKKKSEAVQEMEKLLRQEAERVKRQYQEDSHKLHFLIYLCHLRYQMKRAKQFCQKYKAELNELVNFELLNSTNPSTESQLKEFCGRFKKGELPAENSTQSSLERTRSIFKTSTYQSEKDFAMALLILLLSNKFQCRLCVGFTAEPSLPTLSKAKKKDKNEEKLSKSDSKQTYWIEYFDELENEWISVHPLTKNLCDAGGIEKHCPFSYVLGIDNNIVANDMTGWYVRDYLKIETRKRRVTDTWINDALLHPDFCSSKKRAAQENQRLRNYLLAKPLPTVISEFKNHPLYVLEKGSFKAIYPKDTQSIGQIRGNNIYPRNSVVTLQGELNWIREARSVKEGEEPYKVVKARPKLSVPTAERVPLFLNVFGYWQTEKYKRPRVLDGKIPRNEYGNVYMYKPEMVPIGCVHLRQRGVLAMARTLDMECVPAVTGWEFSGGRNHPLIEGCVVLAKDAKVLQNACAEWQQIRHQKKAKAAEDRAVQLWRRLVKGKILLEKLKTRLNVE